MAFVPWRKALTSSGVFLPSSGEWWLTALAFLISAWAVFGHLGDFPLIAPDEGRNAEVAREMNDTGNWLVPIYDGAIYLDKPAFFFRIVGFSLSLFGHSEWAARLPSALFAFGLLIVLFAFCRRVYDSRAAALAMLIAAATPLFMAFSRLVIFDMTLAFFVCSAIFAAYLAEEYEGRRRTRWYWVAAAATGFATLTKGPVGFLIPLLVMAAFHGSLGRADPIRRFLRPAHWLIFLGLVLPWFVGLSLACPDFPYYGIMKESIARFSTPEFHRTAPVYFYGLIIAGCFFSWSLLLPESTAAAWRARRRISRPDRLFIVWALVVVVFFSLSKSKLPGYILTGVVALGVLAARVFAAALEDPGGTAARIVHRGTLALLALAGAAALLTAALALNLGGLEHSLKGLKPYAPGFPAVALSLTSVALLAAQARRSRNIRWAFAAFLSVPLLLISVDFELLSLYAESRSARHLAEMIPHGLPFGTELACLKCLPNGLPFYLEQLVTVISDDGKELTSNYVLFSLASGKTWPERIVPMAHLDRWLAGRSHPIFLIAGRRHWTELDAIAVRHRVASQELGPGYRAILLPAPAMLAALR